MQTDFPIKAKIKYEKDMIEIYKHRTKDDREHVKNTEVFPFKCIGALVCKQKDGDFYLGTATLIAPNYILTCAHNPYENKYRSDEFYFLPGINNKFSNLDYSKGESFFIFDEYEKTETGIDLAIMKLEKPLGNIYGWFDLKDLENKGNEFLNFYGYPGDKYKEAEHSYQLWGQKFMEFNVVQNENEDNENVNNYLTFKCDSYSGMSGSPIFEYNEKLNKVNLFGVFLAHEYENNQNKRGLACLLNDKIINKIQSIIKKENKTFVNSS